MDNKIISGKRARPQDSNLKQTTNKFNNSQLFTTYFTNARCNCRSKVMQLDLDLEHST
jgi:hypothetical protein